MKNRYKWNKFNNLYLTYRQYHFNKIINSSNLNNSNNINHLINHKYTNQKFKIKCSSININNSNNS